MIQPHWHLLPIYGLIDGRCACRRKCASPGKHPQTRNGVFEATNDKSQIHAWIKKDPFLKMAVRTGPESGIWVLNLDFKTPPEMMFWDATDIKHLFELGTLTVATPRGYHFYFQWPKNSVVRNRLNIYPKVSAIGRNGYVIMPTTTPDYRSIHLDSWGNEWVEFDGINPIQPTPDFLLEKVLGT